jgi:hypothetical protein
MLVSVENVPVVLAVLDKGHQSKRTSMPLVFVPEISLIFF